MAKLGNFADSVRVWGPLPTPKAMGKTSGIPHSTRLHVAFETSDNIYEVGITELSLCFVVQVVMLQNLG